MRVAGAETTAAPATAAGAGAAAAEPEPAPAADPESEAGPVVYYDLKGAVALNCSLDNPAKLAYVWCVPAATITAFAY